MCVPLPKCPVTLPSNTASPTLRKCFRRRSRGCSIECCGACYCLVVSSILNHCETVSELVLCSIVQYSKLFICQFSGGDACQPKVHDPRAAKTDEIPFMHVLRVVRNIHSPLHVVFRSGTRRDGARILPKHPSMALAAAAAAAVLLCTAAEAKCSAG